MIKILFQTILILCFVILIKTLSAQTELDERAVVNFNKGIGFFSPDSSLGANMRFRMQNLIGISTVSGDNLSIEDIEARTKRLRLRFDGFIKDEKIKYYMQLSFSRNDIDWDNTQIPNIVRDAMVYYHTNKNLYFGFGQSKLPGNRQRVISSGSQQFIDRSFVNANFTLDRDFGIFAYYSNNLSFLNYNIKAAVSTGDGRTAIYTDDGLAYTGRIELLPFGSFTKDGDFVEGDIYREKIPKLSLAGGYSYNKKAGKSSGQRGKELFEKRDLEAYLFDFIFKYSGLAISSEYISRSTSNPFTTSALNDTAYVVTGYGINSQISYIFKNNLEFAFRYAYIKPDEKIKFYFDDNNIYTLGATKYLKEHKLKVQSNISYNYMNAYFPGSSSSQKNDRWLIQFQVELGI